MSAYQPGYCNIGARERRRRYVYAGIGGILAVGYVGFVLVRGWPAILVVGVFAPLAAALEWFVQARTAFCVRFAFAGRYDFTGSGGATGEVRNADHRRADRLQATRITAVALSAAAGLTGLLYGLVVFLR